MCSSPDVLLPKQTSLDLRQRIVIPAKRSASRDRKKDRRFDLLRSRIRLRLSGTTAAAIRWRVSEVCLAITKVANLRQHRRGQARLIFWKTKGRFLELLFRGRASSKGQSEFGAYPMRSVV